MVGADGLGCESIETAECKLVKFMHVLKHIRTYTDSDSHYNKLNHFHNLLAYTHLKLIVGETKSNCKNLLSIIDPRFEFFEAEHVVLIDTEENAKVHATIQFIVSLIVCCSVSTICINIYGHTPNLPIVLREYLDWLKTPEGMSPNIGKFTIFMETDTRFCIRVDDNLKRIVRFRPVNLIACRGDNADAFFFMDAALRDEKFIRTFAFPIISFFDISTLIITFPEVGTSLHRFIEMWQERNIKNDKRIYIENQLLA